MSSETKPTEEPLNYNLKNLDQVKNPIKRMFYTWITPYILYARKSTIHPELLPLTNKSQTIERAGTRTEKLFNDAFEKGKEVGFFRIFMNYKAMYLTGVYNAIFLAYNIFTPFVVKHITEFTGSQMIPILAQSWSDILPWLIPWIILAIFYVFTQAQLYSQSFFVGSKIRAGLQSLLYRKLSTLPASVSGDSASGSVVNLLINDTLQFIFSTIAVHYSWVTPLCFVIGFFLLATQAGWACAGAYVGTLVLLIPIGALVSSILMKSWVSKMAKSDERVNKLTEVLQNVKITKLMAWEDYDHAAITNLRIDEVADLKKVVAARNTMMVFINFLAVLSTLITTVVYLYTTKIYSLQDIVLVTLLTNSISYPLVFGAMMFVFMMQTRASLSRINAFLKLPSRQEYTQRVQEDNDIALTVAFDDMVYPVTDISTVMSIGATKEQAKLLDSKKSQAGTPVEQFHLRNIDLKFKKGETVAIVGDVASGKTSLLMAILSELEPYNSGEQPLVKINGSLSYFQQNGCVFNDTVRDNILFNSPYDDARYNKTITECCLRPDLDIFPAGDMTEIGERGSSTSGGQRARVDLARCVYSNSDILLLDDPLSAVDAHISKALMKNVILDTLKDKTVILCTHQLQVLPSVDRVIVMKEGTVVADGLYEDVQDQVSAFHFSKVTETTESHEGEEEKEEVKEETSGNAATIEQEEQNEGRVGFGTFKIYFKYSRAAFSIFLAFFMPFAYAALTSVSNWWLNTKAGQAASKNEVLSGYAGCAIASLGALSLAQYGSYRMSINVSRNLHSGMLSKVLHAPISWFTSQPLGRIQNRFSGDLQALDVEFAGSIGQFITQLATLLVAVVFICLPTAYMLIAAVVCLIMALGFLQLYRPAARDFKRCDNILRSPVLSHTSQTLNGMCTVRAYDEMDEFVQTFNERANSNTTSNWMLNVVSVWQQLYMLIAATALQIIVYIAICGIAKNSTGSDVGTLITAVTSVSQLSWSLIYLAQSAAQLEQAANSVERVQHYIEVIPQEPDFRLPDDPTPETWPTNGKIEFTDVCARYRPDLPQVIKDLSICIEGGQRIGIVGRSGAGKSTLTNVILRILEIESGQVLIDDVNIHKIGLHTLRDAVAIIPQDPLLNSGNLRSVLDPGNKFDDIDIWKALDTADLGEYFRPLQGLDSPIASSGSNLSAGQRQLLCLARALLKNSKIICIDEATSSVSFDQDALIQQKIRTGFANATILAVAHRINTIIDFDKIIVMDKGQISEYGSPTELYQSKGLFYSLCESARVRPEGALEE